MTADDVLALFRRSGALLEGHFCLSSGLHSGAYLQCALVLQYPQHAEALGRALAAAVAPVLGEGGVATVLSPALGGIVIGHEVARALGARALFAERQEGRLVLRRGFRVTPGERALVVEDVVTTGGSTQETVEVARAAGAHVAGAAALVDRSTTPPAVDVPFVSLVRYPLPVYAPAACPLCARGVPLDKPGSRA
jgi:orotate phosphoribosyltransferase